MHAPSRHAVFSYDRILGLALAMLFPLSLSAQSSCQQEDGASFQLGAGNYAGVPTGRFLLIRKDGHLGAIRIVSSHRNENAPPRSAEWIGTVDYESFYSDDSARLPAASRHLGQVTLGRMKGFGFHYSYQSVSGKTVVGPWQLRIDGPHSMIIGKYINDKRYEFAATSACSLTTIPPAKELQWFHYDPDAQHKFPVSELPGDR